MTDDTTNPAGLPPATITIDAQLVLGLLREQHPDLAGHTITHIAEGWDNTTFRLGDDLAVRLPRIPAASALLRNEQRWLPDLAAHLPIPIPVPIRTGRPSEEYPWPWSIVPWVSGRSAEHEEISPTQAPRIGRFLAALHHPAPAGAPRNTWRGIPLATIADQVAERIDRLAADPADRTADHAADSPSDHVADRVEHPEILRSLLAAAIAAPCDVAETWIHGDLHPKNIVVRSGTVAAVIDWGDMTVGDPAADLASAWMLFPVSHHAAFFAAYGTVSDATMARALGWAIHFGTNMLEHGLANDPPFAAIGRRTLARICEPALG